MTCWSSRSAPGRWTSWGLGYDDLRRVNPGLVMLSSSLMGQTGPLAHFAGFGNLAGAITGFYHITGWPDRPPAGPYLAYTDYTSPRLCAGAAARRARPPAADGRGPVPRLLPGRGGGALPGAGAHRAHDDRAGLRAARQRRRRARAARRLPGRRRGPLGGHRLHRRPRPGRRWPSCCDRADLGGLGAGRTPAPGGGSSTRVVGAWCAGRDAEEVQATLQARGVAAHQVQNSAECVADPQLAARRHFRRVPHATNGTTVVEGPAPDAVAHAARRRLGWADPGTAHRGGARRAARLRRRPDRRAGRGRRPRVAAAPLANRTGVRLS